MISTGSGAQASQNQPQQETIVVDGKQRNVKVCKTCQKKIFWILDGKKEDGSDKFQPMNLDNTKHEHPKASGGFGGGGGFKKEWRPLVFAFHLPAVPDVATNRKMLESFKKDNPKCYLTRYEVKEDGKGYYIFEEKASLGSS